MNELKERAYEILGPTGRKVLERIRKYDLEVVERNREGDMYHCRFARKGSGIRGGAMRNIRYCSLTAEQIIALMDLKSFNVRRHS